MKHTIKTILYVDDDQDDLDMLRGAVEATDVNFQLIEAFDGVHALELLRQMKEVNELPCLIVLDINMPRMDGKQTLAAIKRDSALRTIPVVLFSTSSSSLDKTFAFSKNVELITKPLTVETLHAVATKLLHYCDGHLITEALYLKRICLVKNNEQQRS